MVVQCENEKCKKEHDGSYGSGRFCSEFCARNFVSTQNRKEKNKKISLKLYGHKVSQEARERAGRHSSQTKLRQLLEADFDSLTVESKKKRVIVEQDKACSRCGIKEWMGTPLTLQVDHADGDTQNNQRENLRGLCPNCHSQTPTYCGKGRGRGHRKGDYEITDERLLVALLETRSIGAALESLGKNRNALNYRRCKALLERHGGMTAEACKLAECGFCHQELKDRPHEEGKLKFCNQSCSGKFRALVRHGNLKTSLSSTVELATDNRTTEVRLFPTGPSF